MMDTVMAARAAFGMSLMFHIIFASLGVVMPFMLLVSQYLYLRRKNPVHLALNMKWTTAFAVTYAIGAVSGTVLTFGLGLFFPNFVDLGGPVMGYPLAIKVLFFLLEAIFLGIYLFGRELLSPWVHWACAIPLFIGGFVSMFVVILGNSWMNTPVGFTLNEAGTEVVDVDILRSMFAPAWWAETSHMAVAAFEAVGFAFAAVYASYLWEGLVTRWPSLVLMGVAVLALISSVVSLYGRRYQLARAAAIVHVTTVLCTWAAAQFPYLLAPDVTIAGAASPRPVLVAMLILCFFYIVVLGPSLLFFFRLFKAHSSRN